ncbi:hypothetical protein RM780_04225 [Streptomyces sp. DSM 44917]|uniref:Uncharacterized protein n=1 Tax=Streptomyces boetiae TaxID=3075541 RepID=A0ABU2L3P2_9ACTN|nr:hypothetical protein [Streptomyces sp. DSM 44917]MDT0306169.1 hypothetical protein [Streptomyces sp. DSM 44917]
MADSPRPRRLTPAERLAADARDTTLARIIADTSAWDLAVVKRAILAHGRALDTFSANDFRELLPDQGAGYVGAACRALAASGLLQHTGTYVPSTLASTHGHRIAVYRLAPPAEGRAAA